MRVIRLISWADGSPSEHDGKYLRSFDPDHDDGTGKVETTESIEDAQKFESTVEAVHEWQRKSTVHPVRVDGKPNRPLTAWSIVVERANEQA